ncbi:hypothetical protein HDR58_08945 [bacterium]|nr:hypothetical protein [bacterium]
MKDIEKIAKEVREIASEVCDVHYLASRLEVSLLYEEVNTGNPAKDIAILLKHLNQLKDKIIELNHHIEFEEQIDADD